MIRRIAVLPLVALVALVAVAAAQAKGPSAASVTGPGIDGTLVVRGSGEDGGSSPLGRLTEDAGFFPAVFGQQPDPMLPGRPTGDLGPRYTITYIVPGPSRPGARIRQRLYPYAAGGPVTYMSPGQRFWETERTRGGWFRGPATLKTTLVDVGLPATPPQILLKSPPGSSGGSALDGAWPYVVLGGIALVVLAAAALAIARRRPGPAATP
jgi:hypothetical protein